MSKKPRVAMDQMEADAQFQFWMLESERHVIDKLLMYVSPEGDNLLQEQSFLDLYGFQMTLIEEQLWLYGRLASTPWLWAVTPDGG